MKTKDIVEHFISQADWVEPSRTRDRVVVGDQEKDFDRCLVVWMPMLDTLRTAVERGFGLIITHEAYLPSVSDIPAITKSDVRLIGVFSGQSSSSYIASYSSLIQKSNPPSPIVRIEPDHPAVIAYTSGTTGFPKGVVHSHGNIITHLSGIRDHLGFDDQDVTLAALPLFQFVAFLIHVGLALFVGAKLVIMKKFEAQQFLNLIKREKVTFFAAVPTIYQMLLSAASGDRADLPSLRFGLCAGSPLSPRLRDRFEQTFNLRIIHCYGMTEIALIAACENLEHPVEGVSVGKPMPYIRLRIIDEGGNKAKPGESGEIQIGAERALRGYWNNPEETSAAIRAGWFSTGDIGRFDDQGRLSIVDRKKDMIIRGGFNVYPAEIERVLLQDPRVAEAAVIGIPHERLGEIPRAFVVLKAVHAMLL